MVYFSRRSFLSTAGGSLLLARGKLPLGPDEPPRGAGIAVTIDDFMPGDRSDLSFLERDEAIREALGRHGLKAAAFPVGKHAELPAVAGALREWARAGHMIGNHTYDHQHLDRSGPTAMMEDVRRAEIVLAPLETYVPLLRFPYLAEGGSAEVRDAMRAALAVGGYRNAHVTVDTSDWYISGRLQRRWTSGANVEAYRRFFIGHIVDRVEYYDGLAVRMTGRADVNHVLLLHHNLACALFLDELLTRFRERGWRLVDVETAYQDPLYREAPTSLPAGQSLLWAMANTRDREKAALRFPGEGERYLAPLMDGLGL